MARSRRWQEMAKKMGIEIVFDEDLERARKERLIAVAQAEFLGE